MKWLKSLLLSLVLCSCTVANVPEKETVEVRVTYYWPGSCGQVGNITSTGKRAKHLETCAVNPRRFAYGSQIYIHEMDLTLTANDTGSWVVKRVAARKMGRDVPVIDVFVRSRAEAQKLIKKYPHFMKITVDEPQKK